MRRSDWHLTTDVDAFLARTGEFLRSRPALHTMPLTTLKRLRRRGSDAGTLFGLLESGDVRAICYRLPPHGRLTLTPVSPEHADDLAAHLADLGHRLAGVTADDDTATAFAGAWHRQTGAWRRTRTRVRLHRLGTLTPPEPLPEGRGRVAGEQDNEQVIRWCNEFLAAVGEAPSIDAGSWAGSRFADKNFTFWESPDGTPVSVAGSTSMIAGMIRVDPVYTPAHLRGHGYAAAVTVEASRTAQAAGATDVVLFADPANPTSSALYHRIGYVPVTDFTGYEFCDEPAAPG